MTTRIYLLLGAIVSLSLNINATQAQPLGTPHTIHSLLHGNSSHCGHVIDLLYRYGQSNASAGQLHVFEPTRYGNLLIPGSELGDLELTSTALVADETPTRGPVIAVTMRNNSQREICSFQVSSVAVFGRIHPTSPTTTARVERIGAGESLEIQLTLPVDCLAMGMANGQPVGFNTLVVAIDSFDQLLESNESNNLMVLARADLPRVAVAVETAVSAAPAETPASPPVQEGAATAPAQAPPPTESAPATNGSGIDFESLEKSTASANSLTDTLPQLDR